MNPLLHREVSRNNEAAFAASDFGWGSGTQSKDEVSTPERAERETQQFLAKKNSRHAPILHVDDKSSNADSDRTEAEHTDQEHRWTRAIHYWQVLADRYLDISVTNTTEKTNPNLMASMLEQRMKSKEGVIMPDATWRAAWTCWILVIVVYYAIEVPYTSLGYGYCRYGTTRRAVLFAFDILWGIFYTVDIYFNFRTVYVSDMELVEVSRRIALHYLRTWFMIDLLAVVPFDYIAYSAGCEFVNGLRWIRVLKILKVPTFFNTSNPELMTTGYVHFYFRFAPFVKLFFWTIVVLHLASCIWLALDHDDRDYISALYWAVYTLTTVGYGDIVIYSSEQRLFCVCVMFMGIGMYSLLISQVLVTLTRHSRSKSSDKIMRETLEVLSDFDVPSALKVQVMAFQHYSLQHTLSNYHSLFSGLPPAMQKEIKMFIKVKLVNHVPMFMKASTSCRFAIASCLHQMYVEPATEIVRVGDEGNEMFFIAHGFADVMSADGTRITTLKKGAFFGEIALLQRDMTRTASIVTVTHCDIFRLDKFDFIRIKAKYPSFEVIVQHIQQQMKSRLSPIANKTMGIVTYWKKLSLSSLTGHSKTLKESFPEDTKKIAARRRRSLAVDNIPLVETELPTWEEATATAIRRGSLQPPPGFMEGAGMLPGMVSSASTSNDLSSGTSAADTHHHHRHHDPVSIHCTDEDDSNIPSNPLIAHGGTTPSTGHNVIFPGSATREDNKRNSTQISIASSTPSRDTVKKVQIMAPADAVDPDMLGEPTEAFVSPKASPNKERAFTPLSEDLENELEEEEAKKLAKRMSYHTVRHGIREIYDDDDDEHNFNVMMNRLHTHAQTVRRDPSHLTAVSGASGDVGLTSAFSWIPWADGRTTHVPQLPNLDQLKTHSSAPRLSAAKNSNAHTTPSNFGDKMNSMVASQRKLEGICGILMEQQTQMLKYQKKQQQQISLLLQKCEGESRGQ